MGRKLNDFSIVFGDERSVYYAGQTLTGRVRVDVKNDIKLKGLRLLLHGSASVSWTERHTTGSGKSRRATSKVFANSQTYFNHTEILLGSINDDEDSETVLTCGCYEYPFEFTLPADLPPSFESSSYGYIRYWAKANMDIPWQFDKITKQNFTVIGALDMNGIADIMATQEGTAQTTLCCLCCETGPISIKFKLDKAGYVPGEYIYPKGEVMNQSKRTMSETKFEIVQTITFHSKQKSRRVNRVIANLKQDMTRDGDSIAWTGQRLRIPPLPPTGLPGCTIIDLEYKTKVTVDPIGPSFTLQVPLNIIIGTIPLNKILNDPSHTGPARKDIEVIRTYKECVFGAVDVREEDDNDFTMGQLKFAPLYSYYQWPDDKEDEAAQ